jgi:hypothetical protein
VDPSRDGALGVIGVSGKASLIENDLFLHIRKEESETVVM